MTKSPYELFLTKFNELTEIQKLSIGPLAQGGNCIITAPTGSGKTEAAILPLLDRMTKAGSGKGIQVIYVTPLRALNRDLIKRLEWFCRELDIKISVRHGDTPQSERRKQSENPPQLLITTPETLQNLLISKSLRDSLRNLKSLIVDELHELYYNKRGAQLSLVMERIEQVTGPYQRIGISATIGDIEEAARFLFNDREYTKIASQLKKKIEIRVEMPLRPEKDNKEFRLAFGLDVQAYARIVRVSELVSRSNAAIVFANTRQSVESLGSKLIHLGKTIEFGRIGIHHSSIDKEERITTENDFKSGAIKAIIATSSLELGIDIGAVDLIIQYGSPRQVTRLVQRVGRGGHSPAAKAYGSIIVHNELDCLESIAISEAAVSMDLESRRVERNALDVLANQISAMSMEYGSISAKLALSIIRRSYVYSTLSNSDFERTCSLLSDLRTIRYDGISISQGPRTREYFINTISVIPDSSRFFVKEAMENRIISTLDQEFVYNYIDAGSVFITKGLPWKVLSVEEDTIYVEPSEDITAAVPDWDGEDIPVSRKIAAKVWDYLEHGPEAKNTLIDESTKSAINSFISENREHMSLGHSSIVIEELENSAIAYMPTGKQANEFISRIASTISSSQSGGKVNTKATPYAIIFDYSNLVRRADTAKVFQILKNIDLNDRGIVLDSDLFRYKFVQTAKLFGVVEKNAAVTRSVVSKLISFYENSPIADETARDLYKNYFDIRAAHDLVNGLKSGGIKITQVRKTPSPLSSAILMAVFKYGELLSTPERQTVIDRMLDKFEGKSIKMICTYCCHVFNERIRVNDESKLMCSNCKSPLIAVYSDKYEQLLRKRNSHKPFSGQDNRTYRELMKEASLVDAYGYRAIVALSVYGIGLETAARVLKYIRSDYKMFFADVLEAQKNFIKNRRFWKID